MATAPTATAIATPVPADDALLIHKGSGYSEALTWYLYPESGGGLAYIQVAYSQVGYLRFGVSIRAAIPRLKPSFGSLSPISQITAYVSTPTTTYFRSENHGGTALVLNDGGTGASGFTCGTGSSKITVTRTRINGDDVQYTITLALRDLTGTYTFTQPAGAMVRVNDGTVPVLDGAYLAQAYGLRASVTGTLQIHGKDVSVAGRGALVHQYQSTAPYKLGAQWGFLAYQGAECAILSISGTTPTGAAFGTLAIDLKGKRYAASTVAFRIDASEVDPESKYAVATRGVVTAMATADGGDTVEVEARFAMDKRHVRRIDVLSELPWLLRKAIQVLVSKPYVYQHVVGRGAPDVGETIEVVVKKGGEEVVREKDGTALVEVTFTNPI
ncbi:putative cell survival pathways protein [Allomyces arbusculus]|nr:putative cell survival pathways protein [Allomyces arbusculus]